MGGGTLGNGRPDGRFSVSGEFMVQSSCFLRCFADWKFIFLTVSYGTFLCLKVASSRLVPVLQSL